MMRRIFPLIGLMIVAAPAAAADKSFGLTSFDRIVVTADVVVTVQNAAPVRAIASGSPAALDRIAIEVRDRVLTISSRHYASDRLRGAASAPVSIRVNAQNLRAATLIGSGSLRIDRLSGAEAGLTLRGPGGLSVGQVTADRVTIALTGSGTISAAGQVKRATASASGAGGIDAAALTAADLTVTTEGSGSHSFAASRAAAITARGVGQVAVTGRASCTVQQLGGASITCGTARR